MSLLFLFASAFVVGLSGAMMPGPVLTATVGESLKRGFVAGPLIVLGHALLELALLALVVAGFGRWIERPAVLGALGLAGGTVLLLMGAQMAGTARSVVAAARIAPGAPAAAASPRGPVLAGVLLSLSNPYWILWWATIGLNYAALALQQGAAGLASFYAGHISADLAWYSLVSLAVASGRRICPPAAWVGLIFACGLTLCALGLKFAADGAARLGGL